MPRRFSDPKSTSITQWENKLNRVSQIQLTSAIAFGEDS
jgi:hypothetical protein